MFLTKLLERVTTLLGKVPAALAWAVSLIEKVLDKIASGLRAIAAKLEGMFK